jgi:hypothetical protein
MNHGIASARQKLLATQYRSVLQTACTVPDKQEKEIHLHI